MVDYLPSPVDLPPVVGVDPHSEGEITRKPEDSEPFAALAFKIIRSFSGQLTYFRVYSGKLSAGSYVYNVIKEKKYMGHLLKIHANKREEIDEVSAGDITAAGVSRILDG